MEAGVGIFILGYLPFLVDLDFKRALLQSDSLIFEIDGSRFSVAFARCFTRVDCVVEAHRRIGGQSVLTPHSETAPHFSLSSFWWVYRIFLNESRKLRP